MVFARETAGHNLLALACGPFGLSSTSRLRGHAHHSINTLRQTVTAGTWRRLPLFRLLAGHLCKLTVKVYPAIDGPKIGPQLLEIPPLGLQEGNLGQAGDNFKGWVLSPQGPQYHV